MGLPTLLKKGYLVPPKGSSKAEIKKIENTITIDYILNFIGERLALNKKIKKTPKSFGDKVIVLKSDTGSGKSTVLPPKLYETFFELNRKNIAVTQPRVLTAVDIPTSLVEIPAYSFLELDKNLGYSTGTFKRMPTERGIIYSTIGVITQQLISSEDEDFMKKYSVIIIDEVHERDTQTDTCLFLLKKLIKTNWEDVECPLIILTSATFNENVFMDYFSVPKDNYLQVIGMTFPIEKRFPKYNINNVVTYGITLVKKIHLENLIDVQPETEGNEFRDIMIFVSDNKTAMMIYLDLLKFNSDILDKPYLTLEKELINLNNNIENFYYKGGDEQKINKKRNYYILPIILNSENFKAGGLEYQNLFSDITNIITPLWKSKERDPINIQSKPYKFVKPCRRIIIGTNVAETGVTIDTLKYCVDLGYRISIEHQPYFNCNMLSNKNISWGSAMQRKGRVGRKSPGIWYPCYTEETFNALSKDNLAEIISADPIETLLSILIKEKECEIIEENAINKIKEPEKNKLFQIYKLMDHRWYYLKNLYKTNISALDFIELPSSSAIATSLEKLHVLGIIDDNYDITTIGFMINQIRFINIETKKMILSGYHYGAYILDLITIASFINVGKRRIFNKKFKMMKFLKVNDDEFNFYNNIVVGDEFINCIFIMDVLQKFINSKLRKITYKNIVLDSKKQKMGLYHSDIEKWCEDNDLIFDGIIKMLELRDTVIENFISIGLDPYKNSLNLIKNKYNLTNIFKTSLDEGLQEIKKIKNCIFEGFKCNILQLNKNKYVLLIKKIPIDIKSKIIPKNDKPNFIITSSFMLTRSMTGSLYNVNSSDYVSILDNYISVDTSFFTH